MPLCSCPGVEALSCPGVATQDEAQVLPGAGLLKTRGLPGVEARGEARSSSLAMADLLSRNAVATSATAGAWLATVLYKSPVRSTRVRVGSPWRRKPQLRSEARPAALPPRLIAC